MDEFYEKIGKAIEDTYGYKGLVVDYKGELIDFDEDNVEVCVKIGEFNNHMITYVIAKMFLEGKITFKEGCDKDIEYLKKLVKENKDEK